LSRIIPLIHLKTGTALLRFHLITPSSLPSPTQLHCTYTELGKILLDYVPIV